MTQTRTYCFSLIHHSVYLLLALLFRFLGSNSSHEMSRAKPMLAMSVNRLRLGRLPDWLATSKGLVSGRRVGIFEPFAEILSQGWET